jgi:hypothetical protein
MVSVHLSYSASASETFPCDASVSARCKLFVASSMVDATGSIPFIPSRYNLADCSCYPCAFCKYAIFSITQYFSLGCALSLLATANDSWRVRSACALNLILLSANFLMPAFDDNMKCMGSHRE